MFAKHGFASVLNTNSQNETTNNSGNNTDSCPGEFTGYCMNGGYCIYLEEQETVACECPELYGGKGVKISMVYLNILIYLNIYLTFSSKSVQRTAKTDQCFGNSTLLFHHKLLMNVFQFVFQVALLAKVPTGR